MGEQEKTAFKRQNECLLDAIGDEGQQFFAAFMRMEYALKEAGFFFCDKDYADADWHGFRDATLSSQFFAEHRNDAALAYLISNPPRKQIINRSRCNQEQRCKLDWKTFNSLTNNHGLVDALKRVRNNLFHGGK